MPNLSESPSRQLFSLITEMMVILRIMELPSLQVHDLNHVYGACVKFQQKLEAIMGITGQKSLSVFDLPIHLLHHLQDTVEHCGMPSEYSAHSIEPVFTLVKSLVQPGRLRAPQRDLSSTLSREIGFRASSQFMFSDKILAETKSGVKPFSLIKDNLSFLCNKYHLGFVNESGTDEEAVDLIMDAVKKRCLKNGIEFNEDKIKFYEAGSFSIVNAKSEVFLNNFDNVKYYQNDTAIYGKSLCLLTAKIVTPEGLVTMNFVLLELLETFPLIMDSALWFDALPDKIGTPITIGRFALLNRPRPKVVLDAECICSKGYTFPVPDGLTPGKSKKFEFLLDCNPMAIGEILRVPTPEEQQFILDSPQMIARTNQRGGIRIHDTVQSVVLSLEDVDDEDDWDE